MQLTQTMKKAILAEARRLGEHGNSMSAVVWIDANSSTGFSFRLKDTAGEAYNLHHDLTSQGHSASDTAIVDVMDIFS